MVLMQQLGRTPAHQQLGVSHRVLREHRLALLYFAVLRHGNRSPPGLSLRLKEFLRHLPREIR